MSIIETVSLSGCPSCSHRNQRSEHGHWRRSNEPACDNTLLYRRATLQLHWIHWCNGWTHVTVSTHWNRLSVCVCVWGGGFHIMIAIIIITTTTTTTTISIIIIIIIITATLNPACSHRTRSGRTGFTRFLHHRLGQGTN